MQGGAWDKACVLQKGEKPHTKNALIAHCYISIWVCQHFKNKIKTCEIVFILLVIKLIIFIFAVNYIDDDDECVYDRFFAALIT